jgi:DnaJ-class molecular chaperone
MGLDVPLVDALCGFSTTVKGIDGANIPLNVPGLQGSAERALPGHGMPRKAGGRGDLKIKFNVTYPSLSEAQKTQLQQILGRGKF